jgi:NAD(P)H dehydrogenase (quinone)
MYVVEVEIAAKTGAYRSPSGEAGAAFVSRADVARAAAVVLTEGGHEGKTYLMTGPSVVTPANFASIAAELSGKPVRYEPITWEELAEDYRQRRMPEEWVPMSVMLEGFIASNALAVVSDDITRLTGQLEQSFASFAKAALA